MFRPSHDLDASSSHAKKVKTTHHNGDAATPTVPKLKQQLHDEQQQPNQPQKPQQLEAEIELGRSQYLTVHRSAVGSTAVAVAAATAATQEAVISTTCTPNSSKVRQPQNIDNRESQQQQQQRQSSLSVQTAEFMMPSLSGHEQQQQQQQLAATAATDANQSQSADATKHVVTTTAIVGSVTTASKVSALIPHLFHRRSVSESGDADIKILSDHTDHSSNNNCFGDKSSPHNSASNKNFNLYNSNNSSNSSDSSSSNSSNCNTFRRIIATDADATMSISHCRFQGSNSSISNNSYGSSSNNNIGSENESTISIIEVHGSSSRQQYPQLQQPEQQNLQQQQRQTRNQTNEYQLQWQTYQQQQQQQQHLQQSLVSSSERVSYVFTGDLSVSPEERRALLPQHQIKQQQQQQHKQQTVDGTIEETQKQNCKELERLAAVPMVTYQYDSSNSNSLSKDRTSENLGRNQGSICQITINSSNCSNSDHENVQQKWQNSLGSSDNSSDGLVVITPSSALAAAIAQL